MPITGPIVETYISDPAGRYWLKHRYRQTEKPYVRPLPYFHGGYFDGFGYNTHPTNGFSGGKVIGSDCLSIAQGGMLDSMAAQRAYAQAYGRFVNRMKSTADLGVGLVEAKSSYKMIHSRTVQMLGLLSDLRKRDFVSFSKRLGAITDTGSGRRMYNAAGFQQRTKTVWNRQAKRPASYANMLLEYSFGWKPLVMDIGAAINVLQSDFSVIKTVASGTGQDSNRSNTFNEGGFNYQRSAFDLNVRCQIGAVVTPSNPNLALANQLGFINPVAVAWQTLPGSFLSDWFIPVGRFLESFTDFVGFNVTGGYVSHRLRATRNYEVSYWDYNWIPGLPYPILVNAGNRDRAEAFRREARDSFAIPNLRSQIKLPGGDLLGKAASSVAMLIQQLSNRKK